MYREPAPDEEKRRDGEEAAAFAVALRTKQKRKMWIALGAIFVVATCVAIAGVFIVSQLVAMNGSGGPKDWTFKQEDGAVITVHTPGY